ncbi:uracil DNA glycosylase superfamily protein [Streptococcus porcinus]|uniref:Uracil-DNA glycosylase family protein n=1 Tax=Streptococcus porcinus TaxID=1340 RepID=A0A4U9Z9N1_STRPO|nr:uracil-DNA glycosylase family protein [Streptococcus porcinus]MBA2795405.1 uracil-DNA glycosylase family protein [Streptococcus porcinus]VTS36582.1 uracil DNA glycosylase superfamily protein [Streptococcus porcinus]
MDKIFKAIMDDTDNQKYTEKGIEPLYSAPKNAKIVIVGQAPGIVAQETKLFWNDRSGLKLRQWLGVDEETFYHSEKFAILPMDFYYPGKGKGGDLPPRKNFAQKWHQPLLDLLPNVELVILVGQYAQAYYLGKTKKENLTETVKAYQDYLPRFFPLVHPSPRNQLWLKRNPWFEEEVVPVLQEKVAKLLK